jgi:hypothetical protein
MDNLVAPKHTKTSSAEIYGSKHLEGLLSPRYNQSSEPKIPKLNIVQIPEKDGSVSQETETNSFESQKIRSFESLTPENLNLEVKKTVSDKNVKKHKRSQSIFGKMSPRNKETSEVKETFKVPQEPRRKLTLDLKSVLPSGLSVFSPKKTSSMEDSEQLQRKLKYLYSDISEEEKKQQMMEEEKKKEIPMTQEKKSRRMTLDLGKLSKNTQSMFRSHTVVKPKEEKFELKEQTTGNVEIEHKKSLFNLNLKDMDHSMQSTNSLMSLLSPRYSKNILDDKPPEIKKILKHWSKKKSGGVHFLTEMGQNIQKEIQRRHEKEMEDSYKVFSLGIAGEIFSMSEDKLKEQINEKKKKKRGVLKMKHGFMGNWKEFYCVLRSDKMIYYKSKKDYHDGESQVGSIFLISASIDYQEDVKNHENCFNLISRGNDNLFECSSVEERKEWVNEIRHVISDYYTPGSDEKFFGKSLIKVKNPTYIENEIVLN